MGEVELDESECLHLGLSATEILKCGSSLWDVAVDLSGDGRHQGSHASILMLQCQWKAASGNLLKSWVVTPLRIGRIQGKAFIARLLI